MTQGNVEHSPFPDTINNQEHQRRIGHAAVGCSNLRPLDTLALVWPCHGGHQPEKLCLNVIVLFVVFPTISMSKVTCCWYHARLLFFGNYTRH